MWGRGVFRHALRNRADFSGDNYSVKKWHKSAPKRVKKGGGLQECYVIFKGGYSKVLRGVTGGRGGVNFAQKKRYVIFERPLRCSASPCQMTPFSPPRERSLRSNL